MKKYFYSLLTLLLLILGGESTYAGYGIYYGTSQTYAKTLYSKYDTIIMQDYNYSVFKSYTGKKVCYLSVGEFDGTSAELSTLGLTGAVIGYNSEWNSFIMDMGNNTWINYLKTKEIKLKNLGCNGVFLDTIWQDGYEKQAINLTKTLKENWKESYIVVNNGHNIKNEIIAYVDAYMFENFWDYGTKIGTSDAEWYITLSKEYQKIAKENNKKIYTLSYGNPQTNSNYKKWADTIKLLCKNYGFEYIFSNLNLTKIY